MLGETIQNTVFQNANSGAAVFYYFDYDDLISTSLGFEVSHPPNFHGATAVVGGNLLMSFFVGGSTGGAICNIFFWGGLGGIGYP